MYYNMCSKSSIYAVNEFSFDYDASPMAIDWFVALFLLRIDNNDNNNNPYFHLEKRQVKSPMNAKITSVKNTQTCRHLH